MLYHFLVPLHTSWPAFNVFRYITFRTLLAALTALCVSLVLGPWLVRRLSELQIGQTIRSDGPPSHHAKAGTPTMGGTLILFSLVLATVLLADLTNAYVWIALSVTVGFGVVGFVDDYRKVTRRDAKGLRAREKLLWQTAIAGTAALVLFFHPGFTTELFFPFFKDVHPDLGWFYVPFATLVVVGASNAVNLTDGLDGLAIGPVMTTGATYVIFAYAVGHARIAEYLQIPYVPGAGELAVFCGALVCAGLGFLWFNAYPASMFMGDVGALPLGAALGIVALLTKHEIALGIAGAVFVAEALSVIVQVLFFKLRRRRILRMAPLHHHFELLGWPEPQIIVRFWIVSVVFALVALSTLKLR
ncbi:MAG: phospho-N-acetylmuramoyl-pentapeptide-transferase [Candidatus Binatia bacterium]|nr:MAG: phospho-N-acetylmuramoyl-pentapeptide-transferase [Candidatus Binatia bacterium]